MSQLRSVGLAWKKLDLHVHTAGSADFTGTDKSAQAIIVAALAKGLDGIAVTDHNSAAWVDRIIDAAKGTQLAVFPGVEITTSGGLSGIHVIALFDQRQSTKTIEGLLAKVDILPDDHGRLDCVSPKGVVEVIDIIDELGGLAILAHADSSKGVFHDMKGQPRLQVVRHLKLAAVELGAWEKNRQYVDGSDPDYKRHLAAYRASDNRDPKSGVGHAAEGIGARFSWFKMDGLTLNSLRQCFSDPEIRIIPDELCPDRPDRMYPRVRSLAVSSGFLSGAPFQLHPGVNSIIGGKGVGKSLLIELLRFALEQPSPIQHLYDDMLGKLRDQVGVGGTVTVEVQLGNGEVLRVAREFDDDQNRCRVSGHDGREINANIGRLFPILAYSQTEAHEIARSNDAQLSLIDSLIDHSGIDSDLTDLRGKIAKSDGAIASAALSEERIEAFKGEMDTLTMQIAHADVALASDRHDALARMEMKTKFVSVARERVTDLESVVGGAADQLSQLDALQIAETLADDVDTKGAQEAIKSLEKELNRVLTTLDRKIGTVGGSLDGLHVRLKKAVDSKRTEYNSWAAAQGGNKTQLTAKRSRMVSDLEKLRLRTKAEVQKLDARIRARAARDKLLDQLDAKEEELYQARLTKYAEIQSGSNGRLQLELVRGGNRALFHLRLLELKVGSNLQDTTIRTIAEAFRPRDLVKAILDGDAAKIKAEAKVTQNQAEKFISALRERADLVPLLRLDHEAVCIDLPRIKYLKLDGSYHDLRSLSVGQKCTALLIIALSDDERPIIMDQPEDALDTPSVFDDVTVRLRAKKSERQFILTTHNSTVAVAGDTDQYHVLTASAASGELEASGALDRPQVLAQVIQHLEGGSKPFAIKSRKYSVSGTG